LKLSIHPPSNCDSIGCSSEVFSGDGLSYNIEASLRYNINPKIYLCFNTGYLSANTKFEWDQVVTSLNISGGIGLTFK